MAEFAPDQVCDLLEVEGGVDPAVGIPMESFIKYTERYRKEKLDEDLAKLENMDADQMATLATTAELAPAPEQPERQTEAKQHPPDPLAEGKAVAEVAAASGKAEEAVAAAAAKIEADATAQAEKAARKQDRAHKNSARAAAGHPAKAAPQPDPPALEPKPPAVPRERPAQTPVLFDEGNNEFRASQPIPDFLQDPGLDLKEHPEDPEWGAIKYPRIQARTARVLRAMSGSIGTQTQRSGAHNWGHWHDYWLDMSMDEVYSMVVEVGSKDITTASSVSARACLFCDSAL